MNTSLPRSVVYCFVVFCLGIALAASLWPMPSAQAADIAVSGGSGGGGGGGDGASQNSNGGGASQASGGRGGQGGYGTGSGNAGGGGGASLFNGTSDATRNGGNASGTTPGAAGAIVNIGENSGAPGSVHISNVGGAGGNGGSPTITSLATSADRILVYGGNGGRGGQGGTAGGADGGNGGNGGSASLSWTGNMDVSGNVYVGAGEGGGGARATVGSGTSGTGGKGGDASLTANALKANTVFVTSGANGVSDGYGSENPGAGGDVGFFANSLAARTIQLGKNPGSNLAFNVGTLDVTSGDTTLLLDRTTAGTSGTAMNGNGVYIGTARLGDGQLRIAKIYNDPSSAFIGTLQLEGRGVFTDTANPVSVDSLTINGGTLHDGNWDLTTRSYVTTSDITLGSSGATVELNAGQDKTLNRVLTGSGGLTKTGAGTLTLSGANNYSGGTTISAGILSIAADSNVGTGTHTLAGGTLQLTGNTYAKGWTLGSGDNAIETSGNTTFGGVLSGSGGFAKTGAGVLTLDSANTFSGPLGIGAGGLTLGAGGQLTQASALSLGANAMFDYSAATAYAAASPLALQNVTVNGPGARIKPNSGHVANFSGGSLHFNIPNTAVANDILLTVEGDAKMTGTAVSLDTPSGRPNLNPGENVILLDVTGTLDSDITTLTVQTASGDTYTVHMNGQQLQAVLGQLSPTGPAYERLKAYAESRAVSLAFANQGLDFILNRGFGSALAVTSGPGFRFGSFGGLGGGWSRYNTGSHIDVSGMSLLAGLAFGNDIPHGRLTLGAFFEGGWGNYDSHNSFSNAASVDGKGDTSYYGGGILGRYDLTEGALSGLYFDASARMGRAETDFRSGNIQYNGWNADFDSSALYYGLHGGLGYVWLIPGLDNKGSLDLSAKLLWTRQEGDSLAVYQDHVNFKDADSLRTRLGGRFAYSINEYVSPYLGAYWEHEFDGKLRASVNGQSLSSPSLCGDTGMGELGLSLKPSQSLPLSFDLGVQGYTGKREGITGSLQLRYNF